MDRIAIIRTAQNAQNVPFYWKRSNRSRIRRCHSLPWSNRNNVRSIFSPNLFSCWHWIRRSPAETTTRTTEHDVPRVRRTKNQTMKWTDGHLHGVRGAAISVGFGLREHVVYEIRTTTNLHSMAVPILHGPGIIEKISWRTGWNRYGRRQVDNGQRTKREISRNSRRTTVLVRYINGGVLHTRQPQINTVQRRRRPASVCNRFWLLPSSFFPFFFLLFVFRVRDKEVRRGQMLKRRYHGLRTEFRGLARRLPRLGETLRYYRYQ